MSPNELTIPQTAYVTVESIESVHENRENVQGLEMVYEPKYIRFFQARFERL